MDLKINIFLLLMIQFFGSIENILAVVMKCPIYQLNFQKIIGYRPPFRYLEKFNLLNNEIINNNNKNSSLIMPINILCYEICAKDPECMSYVLLIDTNSCYGFSFLPKSIKYIYVPRNVDLITDYNAIYFEKSCLKVPDRCKNKLWSITKIPGSTLVHQGKKTIPSLVTKRECAELCLFETEFLCLSASFISSYKNNYARLGGGSNKIEEVVGQCILSNKDKITQPDAYRAANKDEEYIENECYDRPIENLQCSYEIYSKSSFLYAELSYNDLTQRECQRQCSQEKQFYCQGVTFVGDIINGSKCFLHSDDLISMGPRSLRSLSQSIYMRRVRCLNISVVCKNDEMTIKYSPNDWFRGKIYTNFHSEECSAQGKGTKPTMLRLPIGNEIKESRCGILRAYDMKSYIRRTFLSTLLVIQNNLNVQTQGDRLVKVGCILSNISKENDVPDDISLQSTLAFTQTELPNDGSIHLNTDKELPNVRIQFIDINSSYETNDVNIGQNIELQIIIEPTNTPYDFQVNSLVVRSEDSSSFVLIDKNGCPTDITIFPQFEKVVTKNKKMLRGKFHAFKFTGTPSVSFEAKVHFCLHKCPDLNCANVSKSSYKNITQRSKRSDKNSTTDNENISITRVKTGVDIQTPSKMIDFTGPSNYITFQDSLLSSDLKYDNNNVTENRTINIGTSQKLEVPLKLKLHVRGPYYGETDTLICGENNKILVSGFDFRNPEEWCINHNLLIAIIIFWLIIQIIFMALCCYFVKRYKKMTAIEEDRSTLHRNEGYLDFDGRKVHWADQGTMSEFSASQI